MASQRQLEANRANAKRSTGPKTQNGKARSSMNALTHGLTAKAHVIGDEDPQEFAALQGSLITDLTPAGSFEQELVRQIAGDLWRRRRAARMEAAVIREELKAAEAETQRCQTAGRFAVQELFDKIDAMARRRHPDSEGQHVQDRSKPVFDVEAEKEQKAVKQVPEETRQQSQDRAFAVIIRENKLGNLSRYEAGLMTNLKRTYNLLRQSKSE